jgi:hypothetical protein
VQIITYSNWSYRLFSVYLRLTICHLILSNCILRMYFYRPTRLYQWMASFSTKSTQIILFLSTFAFNTQHVTIYHWIIRGIYSQCGLKPWRIIRKWEVAVSILLCSQSLESVVVMDRWYHHIFFNILCDTCIHPST